MSPLWLQATPSPRWFPPAASTLAPAVDRVFTFVFGICAVFFVLIVAFTIGFVVKYRRRRWTHALPSPEYNSRLELLWTIVPTALLAVIFGLATSVWIHLTDSPGADVPAVQVTARKWSWWFDHPEGKGSSELHVVAGERVRLVMTATDVLHSLWIPAFRLKQDVVPGRFTRAWFEATLPGTYPVYCAEYCGTNHSGMQSQVVVHPDRADYAKWLASKIDETLPLPELGKLVYEERGCKSCHTTDGSPSVGPTFKGLWGKTESLAAGSALVDEDYVRRSILDPKADIVSGFSPVMPATPLSDREIQGIIAYVQSLKE